MLEPRSVTLYLQADTAMIIYFKGRIVSKNFVLPLKLENSLLPKVAELLEFIFSPIVITVKIMAITK